MILQQQKYAGIFTIIIFVSFFHFSFAQEISSFEYTIDWKNGTSTTLTITDYRTPITIVTHYEDSSSYSTIYSNSYYTIKSDSSLEFNSQYDADNNQYDLNPNNSFHENDTLKFYSGQHLHYLNKTNEPSYFISSSSSFLRFRNANDTTMTGKIPLEYSVASICKLNVVPGDCIERIGINVFDFQEAKLDIVLANKNHIEEKVTFANIISNELIIKSTTEDFFLIVNSLGETLISNLKTNVPQDISNLNTGVYYIKSTRTGKSFRFLKL